ncbi:MAG: hypothetical protein UY86_C0008G0023 [Candidatus Adlerbacteria bacterium GW2011_GWB1_54_7]|uniref:Uncharacterized protein n=1 Tax=Candidatus Adlerbacteria bacterium GW2011_GWB1_54_7 TaxID=1618607 RepID=A0A0G1Y2J1_9BACT|nr:MAG: hypothetical protein UY86_C0008G0023 [Candidatus Adlerbacteria bacterium GW2011_GWB1_54_7]
MNTPRDIIFFHSGSVGDFLMYLFLAELFYRANPVVRISIVMPRNTSFLRGFLGSYPYVSILEISKWKPWRLLPLFFRSKSITVIINPTVGRIPLRAKLLGWFLSRRGGTLVGFKDKGPLCGLYSKLLFYDIHKPYHETLIDIVRAFGIEPPLFTPRLAIQSDSDELAERGLKPHRYVVIHPGALAPERSFSPDAVLAMAEAIRVKKPDMDIVVSGGPGDKKLLEEIKTRDPRVILAMALPALQISAIIKEARLYIGVDTGISHLGGAFGYGGQLAAVVCDANNSAISFARGKDGSARLIISAGVPHGRQAVWAGTRRCDGWSASCGSDIM